MYGLMQCHCKRLVRVGYSKLITAESYGTHRHKTDLIFFELTLDVAREIRIQGRIPEVWRDLITRVDPTCDWVMMLT